MNNIRTCEHCGTSWTADELLPCPRCSTILDYGIRSVNEFCWKWRGPNTLTIAYNEALLVRDREMRSKARTEAFEQAARVIDDYRVGAELAAAIRALAEGSET